MTRSDSPEEESELIRTLGADVRDVWTRVGRVGVRKTMSGSRSDLSPVVLRRLP